MVMAEARGVQTGAAIVQNADAITLKPAYHWSAGVGAEITAADAGRAVQGFAQGGLAAQQQLGAPVLGHWRDQISGAKRVGGDRDRRQGGAKGLCPHCSQAKTAQASQGESNFFHGNLD